MRKVLLVAAAAVVLTACKNTSGKASASGADSNKPSLISSPGALTPLPEALKDSANFTTVVWVDSTFKDVGKVIKGQIVEIPFTVRNTGDKPLVITSVQPGCGCTVAEKPEEPILPGKEGKIVAKFNSEGQSEGEHRKNITVQGNIKPTTQALLEFKVDVVNK
ncbi:hypothetical protein A8C56_09330 [Niabella ginsenosidivorans]|uniref:DUF1573 domain-containing protein n=1 Tax=Niabella ginsenosidivorans TaxID=1176587 RepID=A0A1A9I0W1_9BACT|nr:DUF1573 domain-containing protein [Niabella ginsenosidivorans]ANH81153.1 hypothetical protein A8C56_09330 [Niabella ginsenosidivorans]